MPQPRSSRRPLLYSTAIRRAECCALTLHDVDLAEHTLCIRSPKNTVPRLVPLSPLARQALDTWLGQVRPRWAAADPASEALFLQRDGRRLSPESLRQGVHAAFAAIGLSVSPHQLRHACATHLVAAGADLTHVQALLGHLDLGATVRYTHVTAADLHREHARTHPRAHRSASKSHPAAPRL